MSSPKHILIFRTGSLGDTIVSLPTLHFLAKRFPDSDRRILTNEPVEGRAASVRDVLGESGLVDGFFDYPASGKGASHLLQLRRDIRSWGPDMVVYLSAPRSRLGLARQWVFFRSCGARSIVGMPWTHGLRDHADLGGLWESEAARLARGIKRLGEVDVSDPASWRLDLSSAERSRADQLLSGWDGEKRFIGFSIGAKADVKDWGDGNWRSVLSELSSQHDELGLAILGSAGEAARGDAVARSWQGPVLNLSGKASPRESAGVLARAQLFLGHDSGPMHLAAAMGTPTVSVFSARNKPGAWFPYGNIKGTLYERVECFDCRRTICEDHRKKCIMAITPTQVLGAVKMTAPNLLESPK